MARTFVCAIVVAIFVTIPAVASQLCQLYQTERNIGVQWLPETLPAERFEITFRVLALGDVYIYLGDGPHARLAIGIGVDQNSATIIKGNSGKTYAKTPGIIKCDTFSEFWLLYSPSFVKLGRVGQTSPIVTLFHSESYVPTRLGFSTSSVSVGLFSFDPFGKTAPTFFEQEFNTCTGFCYDWRLNPMPLGERICFQARTEGVAAIALSPMREPNAGQSLYEIVFGYDENSMIVLRRHMHGEEIEVVEAKDTLNCDEFVSYCIEASGPHIQITRLGDPKILMDFTDSVGIPINYRYIGFAGGFDHCVEWRWPVDIIPKLILETGTQLTEETGEAPAVDPVLPDAGETSIVVPDLPAAETDVQPPLDESNNPSGSQGCAPVRCKKFCPFGRATDKNGCEKCKCNRKGKSSEEDPEISVGETDVQPPSDKPDTPRPRKDRPNNNDKPKTETDVQPPSDETDTPSGNQAVCPEVPEGVFGICSEECGADKKCDDGQLCCSNGCGHVCKKGCSPVRCRRYCPFGWATDEDGCDMCKCKRKGGSKGKKENRRRGESSEEDPEISVGETDVQPPSDKPDTPRPRKDRPNNNNKPKKETDVQPPSDETDTPSGNQAVCPEVPEGVFGICSEECGADKKCDDGQLCCSNGCGHVCKKGCSPVRCRRNCPFGWATDEDGCDMCKCKRKGGSKGKNKNPRRGESSEEDPEISVGETDVQPPSDKPDTPRPRKDRPNNNNKPKKETDVQPPSDETDTPSGNQAVCPEVPEGVFGICSEECGADKKCDDGQLCCSNGCGHVCKKGCSPVRCRRYCPFGWATDEDGCDMCKCKRKGGSKGKKENRRRGESSEEDPEISVGETDVQPPSDKPDTPRPRKDRPNNNNKPKKETDVQPPSDETDTPSGNQVVCPEVPEGVFGICSEECGADKKCDDGQLCCSNGCGHVCKKGCSPVRCRRYCPFGWATDEDGCDMCKCKRKGGSKGKNKNPRRGESSEEDPEISVGETDVQPPSDKPDTPRPRKDRPNNNNKPKKGESSEEDPEISVGETDVQPSSDDPSVPRGNQDGDEGETFTTSGDSSQEIKRTLDKKVISVFEISPFDDKVSKEFQIGCEVGDFKLDVNSETFSLKNGKGEEVDSQTTPDTSGRLKFSIEITESAFIISYILDQDFTTLIEYSPPGREDGKELNCKAFTVKNVDKRRQRGCQIKYTKISQTRWRSYNRRNRPSNTRKVQTGATYVPKKTSGSKPRRVREHSRGSGSGSGNSKGSKSGGGRRGRGSGSGSGKKDKILSAGETFVPKKTSGSRPRPTVRERSSGSGSGSGNSKGSKSGGGRRGRGSGSGSGKKDKILSAGETFVPKKTSGSRPRPTVRERSSGSESRRKKKS
nr:sea star footprint protein 8 [Asterias rubens]